MAEDSLNMVSDWREQLAARVDDFFLTKLGPDITADAIRLAPKDTGYLASHIYFVVEDHELKIIANAPYAAAVENGHREVIFGHETGRYVPPQPYLRPALFRRRRYAKR